MHRYHSSAPTRTQASAYLVPQYTFSADLQAWASEYTPDLKEDDDELHQPEPPDSRRNIEHDGNLWSWRALTNLVPLLLLTSGLVTLL